MRVEFSCYLIEQLPIDYDNDSILEVTLSGIDKWEDDEAVGANDIALKIVFYNFALFV